MSTRLLEAGEALAMVLVAENTALAAGDLPGAGQMLAAKTQALAAFESAREDVVPAAIRARVADVVRRIAELSAENQRLLERALLVQGRVLEMILRAAPPIPSATGYRAAGRHGAPPRPPPMAIRASA